MDIKNCCAFTGHRPSHFIFGYDELHPECVKLKRVMKTHIVKLIEEGVSTYLSGMALGVDIWAAEIVLELKKKHPHLQLIAVIPCDTQASKWSMAQQQRYQDVLSACNESIYVSHQYTRDCMFRRNRYLVDHAEHLLAVYDGSESGGTAYTVQYAIKKNHDVRIISV